MTAILRPLLAALLLATVASACTPGGSPGLLPARTHVGPMDTGGGLPPGPPNAPATPAP